MADRLGSPPRVHRDRRRGGDRDLRLLQRPARFPRPLAARVDARGAGHRVGRSAAGHAQGRPVRDAALPARAQPRDAQRRPRRSGSRASSPAPRRCSSRPSATTRCAPPRRRSQDSQKHMPKAILYSLAISMVLYVLACLVLTGMVDDTRIDGEAAFSQAFADVGLPLVGLIVAVGAILGILTVLFRDAGSAARPRRCRRRRRPAGCRCWSARRPRRSAGTRR